MRHRSSWLALLLSTLAIAALIAIWWSRSTSSVHGPIRGLRLGFGPAQARAAIEAQGEGTFRTVSEGEDLALEWSSTGEGDLKSARLEFHLGQLVAARLRVSARAPEASGPALELSDGSLLARETTPRGVSLTWLSRSCPTHRDEVDRRLADRR